MNERLPKHKKSLKIRHLFYVVFFIFFSFCGYQYYLSSQPYCQPPALLAYLDSGKVVGTRIENLEVELGKNHYQKMNVKDRKSYYCEPPLRKISSAAVSAYTSNGIITKLKFQRGGRTITYDENGRDDG